MFKRLKAAIGDRLLEVVEQAQSRRREHRLQALLARAKHVGERVRFNGEFAVTGAEQLVLGDNVHIGNNVFIRAEGGLTIGDNTHISRNLVLYTVNHRIDGERIPYDEELVPRSVDIGRNVWIGMNVCITPGSKIGDGAIIGMGAVVTGEVPAHSILVGAKWRIVGERDREHYQACEAAGRHGGINGRALD